jgi:hypothetical protein
MLLWNPDTCHNGHVTETYDTARSTIKINNEDHVWEILKLTDCKCNPCTCFCAMSSANDTFITQTNKQTNKHTHTHTHSITYSHTIKPSLQKIQHREWDKHSSIILLLQLMNGSHHCEKMVFWNRLYCSLHLHRYHTVWKLWVHKMPWHVVLK